MAVEKIEQGENKPKYAVCPVLNCIYRVSLFPLFSDAQGFYHHPRCPKHKVSLILEDEFLKSPEKSLLSYIFSKDRILPHYIAEIIPKKDLKTFVNLWLDSAIFTDGLEKSANYFNKLILKRKKTLYKKPISKYKETIWIPRSEMKEISHDYAGFLKGIREKFDELIDVNKFPPLSDESMKILHDFYDKFSRIFNNTFNYKNELKPSDLDYIIHSIRTAAKFHPDLDGFREEEYPFEDMIGFYNRSLNYNDPLDMLKRQDVDKFITEIEHKSESESNKEAKFDTGSEHTSELEISKDTSSDENDSNYFGLLSGKDSSETIGVLSVKRPKKENFIARKISLQLQLKSKRNGRNILRIAKQNQRFKELERFRELAVIHRDFANEIITHIFSEIKNNPDRGIEDFAIKGTIASKYIFRDYHITDLKREIFKNGKYSDRFNLSERFKRTTTAEVYEILHNWFIRRGNLILILDFLPQILNLNDLKLFLSKGNLEKNKLSILKANLNHDIFNHLQDLSDEYLKNYLSQIKNIILKEKNLDSILHTFFSDLDENSHMIGTKAIEILNSIVSSTNSVNTLDDLKSYFVKVFLKNLKTRCTYAFKSKSKVIPDPLVRSLMEKFNEFKNTLLRNSPINNEFKIFKEYINETLEPIKDTFNEFQLSEKDWENLANIAVREEIKKLLSSDSITSNIFSPHFSPIRFSGLKIKDFINYIYEKIRYQFRGQLSELINVNNSFLRIFFGVCDRISNSIDVYFEKPKMKKLTITLSQNEKLWDVIYEPQKDNLRFKFKALSGVQNHFNFTLNMKDVKNPERFGYTEPSDIFRIFKAPPTFQIEGRKIILIQPFKKNGSTNSPDSEKKSSHISMGVDLGLKDYAVLSIFNEETKQEIARYFLDEKSVFHLRFDKHDGRFKPLNSSGNIGNRLYNLQKETRDLQIKREDFEKKHSDDELGLFHFDKTFSCDWAKINRIHSEIVQQLSSLIIKIALYNNVGLIKFEDLSWSKHSKKSKVGGWLSHKQIHWFFAQIRDHIAQCALYQNIKVGVVDARWSSQMCSFDVCNDDFIVTSSTTKQDVASYIGSRNGKRFRFNYGGNKFFDLDADLNAARNISMRPVLKLLN